MGATPLTTSPLMSIGGVVNHLRWVEHSWIENRFVGVGEAPTLRWVVLHLVEENARHNGHLDIMRELLDGTVGD